MESKMTTLSNTGLYTSNLLGEQILSVLITYRKSLLYEMMDMLMSFIIMIIS